MPGMDTVRWGIIATGHIAGTMAEALNYVDEADLIAVGSRSRGSADAFGERWGIPRRYEGYGGVFDDPDVDVVYIGTPHSFHHENVLAALDAGKHVLCEKPLTLDATQAGECVAEAREQGLFLMEAMWMRFIPVILRLQEMLEGGAVGDIHLVEASFCIDDVPYGPEHRLFNPSLGGGALLDLGIYPLSFARLLCGEPVTVDGRAYIGATGVDETNALTLTFPGGAIAQLASSTRAARPEMASVAGTEGRIEIPDFYHPDQMTVYLSGQAAELIELPAKGNGYVHEVEEVHRCLCEGLTESPIMPLDETMTMMRLMDSLRASWGVAYPQA